MACNKCDERATWRGVRWFMLIGLCDTVCVGAVDVERES